MTTADTRCGTYAGYGVHRRRKEKLCEPCHQANIEYNRAWALANPHKRKEYDRREYDKNRKQLILKAREWRKANADKVTETWKAFHEANPGLSRQGVRRRRARRLLNRVESYTEHQVLALYGTDCHICGEPIDMNANRRTGSDGWERSLHIDHVIPISKGGADALENVKPAHGLCNILKGAR